jgi:YebC/PmpR family DNA-binding regulatory protein
MSGHSKWSSIKHKKGKEDAKRGKIFTKIIRELAIAARTGGPDPDNNARLRQAISAAKAANMPNANVERAIKKGAGGEEGGTLEEIMFEGYGPSGVAMLVETMTDNRNRAVSEIRHLLERHNGHMGETGCVSWMFGKRGLIVIEKDKASEDTVMEIALDAGADDVTDEGEVFEVTTGVTAFEAVKDAFEKKGIAMLEAKLSMIPQTTVKLSGKSAEQMIKLMDSLEDHDDVQNVYANFEISDEEMEKLSA